MRFHFLLTLGLGAGLVACLGNSPSFDFRDAGVRADAGGIDASSIDGGDGGPFLGLPSIRGLVLWVRSDRGIALADGGTGVSEWSDQSGKQHDFAAFAGAEPKYVPGAAGAEPFVDFDGQQQYLVNPGALGIAAGADRTLLVVARAKDPVARAPLFVQTSPSPDAFDAYAIEANTFHTQGNRYGIFSMGTAFDSNQVVGTNAYGLHVIRAQVAGAGDDVRSKIEYRFNGTRLALDMTFKGGTGTAKQPPNPTETTLGAFSLGTDGRLYGGWSIVEAAAYDRALTDSELEAVEKDLELRHGI